MSNTIPLPRPGSLGLIQYAGVDMLEYAAAVSAADNAALRAELAKHQESAFHPDWSMLEATREGLAEHQQIIRELNERVAAAEQASRWESDLCQQALERIKLLEGALALAYGHLWHINADSGVEAPVYSADAASHLARQILREVLTVEQRGDGITAARAALGDKT